MGNMLINRNISSLDDAKLGEVRFSSRSSLGDKWALCNGDPISGDYVPDIDPLSTNSWDITTGFATDYTKILYDSVNKIYYGLKINKIKKSDIVHKFSLEIYKLCNGENLIYSTEDIGIDARYFDGSEILVTDFIDCIYMSNLKKIIIIFANYINLNKFYDYDCNIYFYEYYTETGVLSSITKKSSDIFYAESYDFVVDSSSYDPDHEEEIYMEYIRSSNCYSPSLNRTSYKVNIGSVPNYWMSDEVASGYTAYECGNYLFIKCTGVANGYANALFVLDPDSNYSQVDVYNFPYYESYIEEEYEGGGTYLSLDAWECAEDFKIGSCMSKNYSMVSIEYHISMTNEGSFALLFISIDNNTGKIYTATYSDTGSFSYTLDSAEYVKTIVSCYDWDNDLYAMTYKDYDDSNNALSYYYGIYNATTRVYSQVSSIRIKLQYSKMDYLQTFFIINIGGKCYGLWIGAVSRIIEISSMDTLNIDPYSSGYVDLPSISGVEYDIYTNNHSIPYDAPLYLFACTDAWVGLGAFLPTIDKYGMNSFIKVKN